MACGEFRNWLWRSVETADAYLADRKRLVDIANTRIGDENKEIVKLAL